MKKSKRQVIDYIREYAEGAEEAQGELVFDNVNYGVGFKVYVDQDNTIWMMEYTGSKVQEWAYKFYRLDDDCDDGFGNDNDSLVEILKAEVAKVAPKYDYPEGRELSCGHVVYYAHEVMSASMGSCCEACYDRMS